LQPVSELRPDVHRFDEGSRRGYRLEDFHDAWERYLPVTDVSLVTHPQERKRDESNVTDAPNLFDPVSPSISENGSLSPVREAKHA
jgi:hypothetical protein